MSAKIFSLKAEILWQTVPQPAREAILRAVWCGQCGKGVPISDYIGKEIGAMLSSKVGAGSAAAVLRAESKPPKLELLQTDR